MIPYLDKHAWIAALATFALAIAAQELKRLERVPLVINQANVLTASTVKHVVVTNQMIVGQRIQPQLQTNEITQARSFPMMTDILQRSRAAKKQDKAQLNKSPADDKVEPR